MNSVALVIATLALLVYLDCPDKLRRYKDWLSR
jgi:hypothetical protein